MTSISETIVINLQMVSGDQLLRVVNDMIQRCQNSEAIKRTVACLKPEFFQVHLAYKAAN